MEENKNIILTNAQLVASICPKCNNMTLDSLFDKNEKKMIIICSHCGEKYDNPLDKEKK